MNSSRRPVAALAFAVLLSASSASAQRRVFTNEDVQTTPPPAAAAPTPAEQAPAPSTPSAESARTAQQGTPVADLQRAMVLQSTLMDLFGEFTDKSGDATDIMIKERWRMMSVWVGNLMEANQQNINELEQKVPPEQRPKPLSMTIGEEEVGGQQTAAPQQ